jgi:lysophospholipase L1-like esterase
MRSRNIKLGALLASLALAGCFESSTDDNGNGGIKAQYYVAVGNSLTAGFQSGGLRKDFQEASYPVLLANAMGVEDFQIPAIDAPGLGSSKIHDSNTVPLFVNDQGAVTTRTLDMPVSSLLLNSALTRPYNDLGVPGATTWDFMHAYDSASSQSKTNGFFNVVLRGGVLNNTSMMQQAILLHPTVLTMWIGNNDILGGITSGKVIEGVTVTPVAYYSALMDSALDTLMSKTSAHIFLANIPSITTIPFVTTIPPIVLNPATNQPVLDADSHPIPLITEEANVKYVLLPALSLEGQGMGIPTALGGAGSALPASVTLTVDEAATATKLTDGYNEYLKAKADANPTRITLVDVNGLLIKLLHGEVNGLTATFPLLDTAHTAFSLDGIHPNAKGYKEVAKLYITVIDSVMGKSYTVE